MPDLIVTLDGKTTRFPLPDEWTGKIELNFAHGFLAVRSARATVERYRCADCGGSVVVTASVTTVLPASS